MKMKFHAERSFFNGGVGLSMIHDAMLNNNKMAVAANVVMIEVQDGIPVEPFLKMDYEDAQNLMDELYHCGIRPTDGARSSGSMKATQNHLEDMRAIVATKLNVPFKKCRRTKAKNLKIYLFSNWWGVLFPWPHPFYASSLGLLSRN